MREIGINVFITEGCRLTHESSLKLVESAEYIFKKNGFKVRFPIISTTYVEKKMDNGVSIYDFNMDNSSFSTVADNAHLYSVEKHKELSIFDKSDSLNLVLVKSLHDAKYDTWPNTISFDNTDTIFVSETCYESSLAHGIINHFGIKNQFLDPCCLSYGSELLRKDTKLSEDEKLVLSQEFI